MIISTSEKSRIKILLFLQLFILFFSLNIPVSHAHALGHESSEHRHLSSINTHFNTTHNSNHHLEDNILSIEDMSLEVHFAAHDHDIQKHGHIFKNVTNSYRPGKTPQKTPQTGLFFIDSLCQRQINPDCENLRNSYGQGRWINKILILYFTDIPPPLV